MTNRDASVPQSLPVFPTRKDVRHQPARRAATARIAAISSLWVKLEKPNVQKVIEKLFPTYEDKSRITLAAGLAVGALVALGALFVSRYVRQYVFVETILLILWAWDRKPAVLLLGAYCTNCN